MTSDVDLPVQVVMPVDCSLCGSPITQRFFLHLTPNIVVHEACLCCHICWTPLHLQNSCFIKDGVVYCAEHYRRLFLTCYACGRVPDSGDLVRRVARMLFHASCLRCCTCNASIVTGDHASVLSDGSVRCAGHRERRKGRRTSSDPSSPSSSSSSTNHVSSLRPITSPVLASHLSLVHFNKSSRSRTVLSEAQVHTLRSFYDQNPRPDSFIKEQLASLTGLTTRVIRVWFQNNRCKDKKRRQQSDTRSRGLEEEILTVDLPSVGELHFSEASIS